MRTGILFSILLVLGASTATGDAISGSEPGIRLVLSESSSLNLVAAKAAVPEITASYSEPISPLDPPAPANPYELRLGKLLFHDVRLSGDNKVSCSSCHILSSGGDDGRALSVGARKQKGLRNSPTVLNAAFNFAQFWDGRAKDLADQVAGPIHDPLEMNSNWNEVIGKLNADEQLVWKFKYIYGSGPTPENITSAIVAYEEQLVTLNAPFDRFLRGEQHAISEAAKEGYSLFKSLGCISCHQGRNVGGNMYQVMGVMNDFYVDKASNASTDLGRYNVTNKESDRYKFKVPSLRNVAQTAPYFHDGSISELDDAIRLMAYYQLGRPIADDQVRNIVAFLESLTGQLPDHLK